MMAIKNTERLLAVKGPLRLSSPHVPLSLTVKCLPRTESDPASISRMNLADFLSTDRLKELNLSLDDLRQLLSASQQPGECSYH
jgi:hypothetical protein